MKRKLFYRVASAAETLGCSEKTIHRIVERLGLQTFRLGWHRTMFLTEDQVEAIRKQLHRAA